MEQRTASAKVLRLQKHAGGLEEEEKRAITAGKDWKRVGVEGDETSGGTRTRKPKTL